MYPDLEDNKWTLFKLKSVCPSLQCIKLAVRFHMHYTLEDSLEPASGEDLLATVNYIGRVLQSAPSTLSSVVFGIDIQVHSARIDYVDDAERQNTIANAWETFANILAPTTLRSLKTVTFVKRRSSRESPEVAEYSDPLEPEYHMLFRKKLASLDEKGMLCFA